MISEASAFRPGWLTKKDIKMSYFVDNLIATKYPDRDHFLVFNLIHAYWEDDVFIPHNSIKIDYFDVNCFTAKKLIDKLKAISLLW